MCLERNQALNQPDTTKMSLKHLDNPSASLKNKKNDLPTYLPPRKKKKRPLPIPKKKKRLLPYLHLHFSGGLRAVIAKVQGRTQKETLAAGSWIFSEFLWMSCFFPVFFVFFCFKKKTLDFSRDDSVFFFKCLKIVLRLF